MFSHTNDGIIDAYIKCWAGATGDFSWANDILDNIVHQDPERAWSIVLDIIKRSNSDLLIGIIAAGPLEDLLCEKGEIFIDRLEIEAANDINVRKSIGGVWGESKMNSNIRHRISSLISETE